MREEQLIRIPGHWDIPYRYAAGATASHFFTELKDHARLMATVCPSCKAVLLPPRSFCEKCFVRTSDWIEVGPQGSVDTFTITYEGFAGLADAPTVLALIRVDGATTSIPHFLGEVDTTDPAQLLDEVKQEFRVEAVFKTERQGSILDIAYFKPVGSGS